jgi:DNA replication and repair protein RecF
LVSGDRVTSSSTATLASLQVQNFRCIESASLDFNERLNVFVGDNGSGKTSLLEAVHVLGRGRSFRTTDNRVLVRKGCAATTLSGSVVDQTTTATIGLKISPGEFDVRVDGKSGGKVSDLLALLPVQAIPADIGTVILGSPESRRRMLDWGVFHVEHHYLTRWREFRRALTQRNAALRAASSNEVLDAWDLEFAAAAESLSQSRRSYVARLIPAYRAVTDELLESAIDVEYRPGWPSEKELTEVLREGRAGDRECGYTRFGPHRADLQITTGTGSSRWHASHGQQKLLGAALVLALCQIATAESGQALALLLDEPAADLDSERLRRLMSCVFKLRAQVFIAAVSIDNLGLRSEKSMFHVEHGGAKALL